MQSINGITKGTELEKTVNAVAQAEANGVMIYYALARLAQEQGLDDVSEKFIEIANQEAVHAGFYAVLNGKYPSDFWDFLENFQRGEENAENSLLPLAEKISEMGHPEVADVIRKFAAQEKNHGVILGEILKKYRK